MRTVFLALVVLVPSAAAQPLQAGLRVWLDADDAATIVTDTDGFETVASWSNKVADAGVVLNEDKAAQPLLSRGGLAGRNYMTFDGVDDVLRSGAFTSTPLTEATIFLVASPLSNSGNFGAFMSCNIVGQSDYETGINIDLGAGGGGEFDYFNIEGPKRVTPGGVNFRTRSNPFGVWHVIQVNYWSSRLELIVDGVREGLTNDTGPAVLRAEEFRVGGRWYAGLERGFGNVSIAEILVYDSSADCGALNQSGLYLAGKYGISTGYAPPDCPTDFNADCFVDFFDYNEFVLAFETGRVDADVNGDGFIDFFDYDDFVRGFEEGC